VSLVELMVALALGLVLSGAAVTIYVNNKHAYQVQDNTSNLQENGRFALHLLREDIRMAGYWGLNYVPGEINNSEVIALGNECTAGWATDYVHPLTSVNNANTGFAPCIPDADYSSNTDILTIRHASSEPVARAAITENNVYLLTSLTEGVVFKADAASSIDDGVSVREFPTALYKVVAHVYYIRPWSRAVGDGIPALVREIIAGGAVVAEPLVEYVEDFQVTFGLDANSDGSVDRYDDNGVDTSDIDNVMSISAEVLVRAPAAEAGYTNTRTYQLGDRVYTLNDGFRRQVFRDTIFLRNWSGLARNSYGVAR
jgi:type IV pilus assembly protein PilW